MDSEGGLLYAAGAFSLRREWSTRSVLWGALQRTTQVSRFLRLPSGRVHGLAFFPDSSVLVAAAGDGGLWRFDLATAAAQAVAIPKQQNCPGCAAPDVYAVAVSPDGKSLAAAGQGGQIHRFFVAANGLWTAAKSLPTPARALYSLAFDADGAQLAAGAGDGQVYVFDAATGAPLREGIGRGTAQIVAALSFSPDAAKRLAVVGNGGFLTLYDVATGQAAIGPLKPQQGYLSSVAFSPSGQLVAAASEDAQVLLWDSLRGEPQSLASGSMQKRAQSGVSFAPDGRWLASCGLDGAIRIWDVQARRAEPELLKAPGPVYSCGFAPNGTLLASGSDGLIVLWDVMAHPALHRSQIHLPVTALAGSHSGQLVVTGGSDGSVRTWPTAQLGPNPPVFVHSRAINAISIRVDDRLLATGSSDGSVAMLELPSLLRRRTFFEPGHGAVIAVAQSGDGDTVAAGYSDGTVAWFGMQSGRQKGLTKSQQQSIGALLFSADGRFLWSAGLDGTIRTIDVASAQLRCPQSDQNPAHQDAVTSLVQSPRGPLLASGGRDKQIGLWQIDGDSGCLTLAGMLPQLHSAGVATLAFDGSGKRLASGGEDAVVLLWDTDARRPLGGNLTGHRRAVSGLLFDSDGWLWSADAETVWRWDVKESRWLSRACQRAGHNLSLADWQFGFGDSPYCRLCAEYPAGPFAPPLAPLCPQEDL